MANEGEKWSPVTETREWAAAEEGGQLLQDCQAQGQAPY